ncbi:MAG: 3-oxoacyl-ACP reductase family protein [Haloarculaceae archaeon]
MHVDLSDETALVTGAGRGMGRAIAESLADSGADVVLNDVVEERLAEVAETIEGAEGGDALAVPADVTDYEAVGGMVDAAGAEFGGIDVLVNNAGAWVTEFFTETEPEQWRRDIDLNLYGVLNCTRHVLPGMAERGHGSVVSIVSDAGRIGEPRLGTYSAAKAGVVGFTKAVAKEAGRYDVRLNCVSMGTTETPQTEEMLAEGRRERVLEQYPLNRLGRPEDAANVVTFLASDAAEWITGQTVPVNGGYSMA